MITINCYFLIFFEGLILEKKTEVGYFSFRKEKKYEKAKSLQRTSWR